MLSAGLQPDVERADSQTDVFANAVNLMCRCEAGAGPS